MNTIETVVVGASTLIILFFAYKILMTDPTMFFFAIGSIVGTLASGAVIYAIYQSWTAPWYAATIVVAGLMVGSVIGSVVGLWVEFGELP